MRRTIMLILLAVAILGASSSSAFGHRPAVCRAGDASLERCLERNLAHYRGATALLRTTAGERRLGPVERRELRFHAAAARWSSASLDRLERLRAKRLASRSVLAIVRTTAFSLGVTGASWDCLAALISRENANPPHEWNPQRWNADDAPPLSHGSGAYGLGQALPASKMAPYSPDPDRPDHMTSAATQTRWMIAYSEGRYGSVCGADAFQRAHRWY